MVPTIGRIVWYYPSNDDLVICAAESECVGVMVQGVRQDLVQLSGVDGTGAPFCTDWIFLFKPDEVTSVYKQLGGYATWMPYQVAQAEKDNG